MKLIISGGFGSDYIPAIAVAKYLKEVVKTSDFYIYVYDEVLDARLYREESFEAYSSRTDLRCDHNGQHDFVSLIDLGEVFTYKHYIIEDFIECYSNIDLNDPNFISIIESLPSNFHHRLSVIEIPKGKRYRMISYDGSENIELEDDIEWEVAD